MKPKRKVENPWILCTQLPPAGRISVIHSIPFTRLANVLSITFKYQIRKKVREEKGWQKTHNKKNHWRVIFNLHRENREKKKSQYNRKLVSLLKKANIPQIVDTGIDWNMVHFLPERDKQWLQKRSDMTLEKSHLHWKAGVKDAKQLDEFPEGH